MYLRGKSWYSDFNYKGKRYVFNHGPVSPVIAKEKDTIFRGEVVSGSYDKRIAEEQKTIRESLTFNGLAKWYLGQPQVKKLRSSDRVALCLKNFNAFFGDMRVVDLKQADLAAYQEKRLAEGRSNATIDYETKTARTAVALAEANDMVGVDALKPFRRTKHLLRKGENARGRSLSFEEINGLLDNSTGHTKDFILFALYSGMRAGEIRNLRFSAIDFKNNFIRLTADDTKEKRPKSVPLNHHLMEILKERGRVRTIGDDHIFMYQGHEISGRNNIKKSFRSACARAGIPYGRNEKDGITIHDLRRSCKTLMMESGIMGSIRDKILGHTLQGMDRHYLAIKDDVLMGAMVQYTNWLDGHLEKVAGGTPSQRFSQHG